jgi:hypothetical protein
MHSTTQRPYPPAAVGYPRARIRAMRTDDVQSQLERRLFALGVQGIPQSVRKEDPVLRRRVARALRV